MINEGRRPAVSMDEEPAWDEGVCTSEIVVHTLDLSNRTVGVAELLRLPASLTCLDLSRCGLESLQPLRQAAPLPTG